CFPSSQSARKTDSGQTASAARRASKLGYPKVMQWHLRQVGRQSRCGLCLHKPHTPECYPSNNPTIQLSIIQRLLSPLVVRRPEKFGVMQRCEVGGQGWKIAEQLRGRTRQPDQPRKRGFAGKTQTFSVGGVAVEEPRTRLGRGRFDTAADVRIETSLLFQHKRREVDGQHLALSIHG